MIDPLRVVRQVEETEAELINRAREAVAQEQSAPWEVGRCAAEWTKRYAKGRTDADFGELIGMRRDQIAQRRQVWDRFRECYTCNTLPWSHYREALAWDDAEEWLQKAHDNEWSVAKMIQQRETPETQMNNFTGNFEWYTPAETCVKVRSVLGAIDLDPASSEEANETVKARRFFSAQDDGLAQPWSGRVFLNPPYARKVIDQFCEKFIDELENMSAAIVLTNSYTETQWWQLLAYHSDLICFVTGRMKFGRPGEYHDQNPLIGQSLFYYGDNVRKFKDRFGDDGIFVCV